MKNIFFSLLFFSLLLSCASRPVATLQEIKLSLKAPEINLKMEDIADDLQIVALETLDSVLIPNSFRVFANDPYIIISGEECIYQFSIHGKYIAKLLTKGRGPEEYNRIEDCRIDEKQNLLYLLDTERRLFICDLTTSKLKECKKLPFQPSKILEIEDDTLLYYINTLIDKTTTYEFCRMTLNNEIINSSENPRTRGFLSDEYCYQLPNGEIRYKPNGCDTLYSIVDFQKQPIVQLKWIETAPDYKYFTFPLFENSNYYLIQITPIQSKTDAEGNLKSFNILDATHCLVDKKDYRSYKLPQIHVDTLDLELEIKPLHLDMKHIIGSINALAFKEKLKEKYNKDLLSPTIRLLYEKIQENDNPILIIGKTKA